MLTVQSCGQMIWGFSLVAWAAGVAIGYGIAFLKFYKN